MYPAFSISVMDLGSVKFFGAQLERAPRPSSYIPTTTTTVTRTADSILCSGAALAAILNTAEGTLIFEGSRSFAGSSLGIMGGLAETGVFNNSLYLYNDAGSTAIVFNVLTGGVLQSTLASSALTLDSTFRVALTWKNNQFRLSAAGQAASEDLTGTVPSLLGTLAIGTAPWVAGGAEWEGHIRHCALYGTALTAAQIAAFSA